MDDAFITGRGVAAASGRRAVVMGARPNHAVEPPANSVRCAPAVGGGSSRAFGVMSISDEPTGTNDGTARTSRETGAHACGLDTGCGIQAEMSLSGQEHRTVYHARSTDKEDPPYRARRRPEMGLLGDQTLHARLPVRLRLNPRRAQYRISLRQEEKEAFAASACGCVRG
jgi:hypothetical protein